jgi:hypothetical protein
MREAKPKTGDGPRYPQVKVQLTGKDGNAFAVLAAVVNAMRRAGVSQAEKTKFHEEATSGDYDHLLATCTRWVTVS